jgi:uncharacterized repeat protein (TIGR04002 family)
MNKKTLHITTAALFAGLTFIFTYYIKVPIPVGAGYIHLGDCIIFLAASFLPGPIAATSSAVGASLADLFGGYGVYAPFTFVIKAIMALCFTNTRSTILSTRNVVMAFVAGVIMIIGYFIADYILYDSKAAVAAVSFNVVQFAGSAIAYIVIGYFFDRNGVKKRLVK